MRTLNRIRRHEVRIFLVGAAFAVGAFVTVVAVANQGGGAANVGDRKSNEPIFRAPPTAQAPTDIVEQELPDLPYLYRDAFLLVPAGTKTNNPTAYGDERDTWTWEVRFSVSFDSLPDDDLVRVPDVPDGYALTEVTWTEGVRADGSFGGLSGIHYNYEGPNLLPVTVNLARLVRVADGRPYPIVVSTASTGMMLRTVDVAGYAGVYQFPDPERDISGGQLLIVRDGDITVHIDTYRGVAYDDIVAIAESVLTGGTR
jgi:hypothetical protein